MDIEYKNGYRRHLVVKVHIVWSPMVTMCTTFRQIETEHIADSENFWFTLDLGLPPRSGWELRSSGSLRSEWRCLLTDVSGQPIGPILRGQGILDPWRWDRLFVPKVRQEITTTRCVKWEKSAVFLLASHVYHNNYWIFRSWTRTVFSVK